MASRVEQTARMLKTDIPREPKALAAFLRRRAEGEKSREISNILTATAEVLEGECFLSIGQIALLMDKPYTTIHTWLIEKRAVPFVKLGADQPGKKRSRSSVVVKKVYLDELMNARTVPPISPREAS